MLRVLIDNAHGGKDYPCWVTGSADEAKAYGFAWSDTFCIYARPYESEPMKNPPKWPTFLEGGVYRLSQSDVEGKLVSELVVACGDINGWSFVTPDEWLGDCEAKYAADPTGLLVGGFGSRTGFTIFDLQFTGQVLFKAWDDDHLLRPQDVVEITAALSITSNAIKVRRQEAAR